MSLLDEIKAAQVIAGEKAVMEKLQRDGLLNAAKCTHEQWRKEKYPPRQCLECGITMWDAGD